MKANMTVHDIRFKSENALKVLRKGLISKLQITNGEYITINNASLALASRFCDMTPIDVYANSIWNNVGVGKFNELKRLFSEEEKVVDYSSTVEVKTINAEDLIVEEVKIEEPAPIEEVPEPVEEVHESEEEENISETVEDETQESSNEEDTEEEEEVETESVQPQNNSSFSYNKKKKRRH